MTLREAIAEGAGRLSSEEDLRENAQRDAELLLLHVLRATRTLLFTDSDRTVSDREFSEYNSLLERRLLGETDPVHPRGTGVLRVAAEGDIGGADSSTGDRVAR